MKKSLDNISKEISDFFHTEPTSNQKAWGIINHFYHLILTYMDENNIKKADLARTLKKSRSAISQMFNKTPNISIKKMVEIADAVGLECSILLKDESKKWIAQEHETTETNTVDVLIYNNDWDELPGSATVVDNIPLSKSQYRILSLDTSLYNNRIDVN